ncbi:MAG: nitroreductase family protein [Pseudolabrys sp.]|jgi:nitroreductase
MDVREAIFSRRSIREYTSQTVDDETIHHLIEAGDLCPECS